ncbi:MAG: biotin--[acetyl-CoA-carboxylase] ligase [Anaerolineales bacterium]
MSPIPPENCEPLSQEALTARLQTAVVGCRIEIHEEIPSTNPRAMALAERGAPEGTLVLAESQTAGRGRLGRRWFAPPYSSLLMSLLLRPPLEPAQAQRTTMLCSLAIVEGVAALSGLTPRLKWPNDILLGEKKVGGVLTELGVARHHLDHVVVGMGLNVNVEMADLPPVASPATSLLQEVGHPLSRLDLLVAILERLDARYGQLLAGCSPHAAWREHLATLGQPVRVGTRNEVIEGVAEDVDADGALLVRTDHGARRRILVGDVTLRGCPVQGDDAP